MCRRKRLSCSFCGRPDTEVEKLVAGAHASICDRCVAIASDIMSKSGPSSVTRPRSVGLWTALIRPLGVGRPRFPRPDYRIVRIRDAAGLQDLVGHLERPL